MHKYLDLVYTKNWNFKIYLLSPWVGAEFLKAEQQTNTQTLSTFLLSTNKHIWKSKTVLHRSEF